MTKHEKLCSEIALQIARGVSDSELCEKYNITLSRLKRTKKRCDFGDFMKAYQYILGSSETSEILTLTQARATVLLSVLTPNKRPRRDLLELLDLMLHGSEDSNVFLLKYEQRHGVHWEDRS